MFFNLRGRAGEEREGGRGEEGATGRGREREKEEGSFSFKNRGGKVGRERNLTTKVLCKAVAIARARQKFF